MITRAHVIAEAEKYIGSRWADGGDLRPSAGKPGVVDCAHLVCFVGNDLGLIDHKLGVYRGYPENSYDFVAEFKKAGCLPIEYRAAKPGDILIFIHGPYPCHTGIRVDRYNEPAIIHAYARRRRVMFESLSAYLEEIQQFPPRPYPVAFQFPGLIDG